MHTEAPLRKETFLRLAMVQAVLHLHYTTKVTLSPATGLWTVGG